ncbi:MAG: ABC transporter ATP-binding protein [Verrucomicrobiaceae bacterium]|nr:ABC transporter ATP-binding protein [Verrucomicrobiaceae bacterium]
MLEINNLAHVVARKGKEPLKVLEQVSCIVPGGHVLALIGPTASGKTTLLRILGGLTEAGSGTITLKGRDLIARPLHPNQLGWVTPNDECLHEKLTVRENLMSALMLRSAGLNRDQIVSRVSHVLVLVGLENIATERVSALALAQRRRLKLGLALVADPVLVLCDDFTAGLDVRSEREMEALMRMVAADRPNRIVIHATDSLANLAAYDTALVLHEGFVCYHGPAKALPHYFTVPTYDEVYSRLAKRPAQRWGDSWMRHRDSYYAAFKLGTTAEDLSAAEEEISDADQTIVMKQKEADEGKPVADRTEEDAVPVLPLPGLFAQASHLVKRRWSLLRRTPREWVVHLGLLAGAPVIAWLLLQPNLKHIAALKDKAPGELWLAACTTSMIYFIMVLLILFMSLRLAAREIAARRATYDRERIAGVRPAAALAATLLFVLPLSLLQSFWMGMFLELVSGGLPGQGGARLALPALTGIAFAALCLGISANARSSERAHSLCLTLLLANVLFSGALLGFPRMVGHLVHPFITAHYGWSGILDTLHNDALFQPLTAFLRTWFATPQIAASVLGIHFLLGLIATYIGLRRRDS